MRLGLTTRQKGEGVNRQVMFLLVCLVCTVGAVGYVAYTIRNRATPAASLTPAPRPAAVAALEMLQTTSPTRVALLYRSTAVDATYGRLALLALASGEPAHALLAWRCERVHFAAGWGVCLTATHGMFPTYSAEVFDAQFVRRHHFSLPGLPSRTRVAADGQHAAITVFVTGHSYAGPDFSTQTIILNPATGEILGDLEQYTVYQDGVPFRRPDFNFWGVTFTPHSERFYATLRTAGKTYLIEGHVSTRQAWIQREGVECPSLSPDSTRLAFKKRLPGSSAQWRLHVLDLGAGTETALAETRSVDDQVAWLDNHHIMYALPASVTLASPRTHVWMVAADGTGTPQLLTEQAYSPVVVHRQDGLSNFP